MAHVGQFGADCLFLSGKQSQRYNIESPFRFFNLYFTLKKFKAILRAVSSPYSQMPQTDNEKFFLDPSLNKKLKFPSIKSEATIYLSVVVPSYNEETRRNLNFFILIYFTAFHN